MTFQTRLPLSEGAASRPMPAAPQTLTIAAGPARLAATLHRPMRPAAAAVVITPEIGVPQRFYQAFAAWVASDRGMACLTFDYRGTGLSATGHPRRSAAMLADWGVSDQQAVLDAAAWLLPGIPLWLIGHGFGGAMLPWHRPRALGRVVTVAAGIVLPQDLPWPRRMLARLAGPRVGSGEAAWPSGLVSAGPLAAPHPAPVCAPMRFVAVADDRTVPVRSVWRAMDAYPEAVKRQRVLHPSAFGLARIGHLGAFLPENAAIWPALLD